MFRLLLGSYRGALKTVAGFGVVLVDFLGWLGLGTGFILGHRI